ncbi:hypothetical protein BGZ73_007161 [Actinomortierella ambigua]|nr:hypothetical protein BGZ73_007161 [Actinomortierella ambigua]
MTNTAGMYQEWTDDIEKARVAVGVYGMSVAVVHKGNIVYAQGFGKRNDIDPFTPETVSQIGSMTKAFTAVAVGELIAEGKAKWDDPVSEYLPEFRLKDPRLTAEINFVDLLAHRTGYPRRDLDWIRRSLSRIELIKLLKHVDPEAPLRTEFIYNNLMYSVAGEAASRIAGTPYEELVLEKVLRPLGMKDSGFSLSEMVAIHPNHALPYTAKSSEDAKEGRIVRAPLDPISQAQAPAGDIYSNAIDMAKWCKAIMHEGKLEDKQVLHKDTVNKVTTAWNVMDRSSDDPDFSPKTYGLGWEIQHYKGHQTWRHAGGTFGYRSEMALFPKEDLAVVVLTNHIHNGMVDVIANYVADRILNLPTTKNWLYDVAEKATKQVYDHCDSESPAFTEFFFPPQLKDKPSSRPLKDFAGEYAESFSPELTITLVSTNQEDGDGQDYSLAFKLATWEGTLEHYHYDSFRIRVRDGVVTTNMLLTFLAGDDGLINQCRVLRFDGSFMYTKKVSTDASAPAKEE